MARRGKFGRRPRSSPDLSATIVAMAREYQNMRDRNILNAWQKGGKFEGQQVTDEMLLSHLEMRRDGLSPDDALYDEYSQRVTEYTFAIDNSKMELRYAQGKVGDAGMANFYRKAAGKLPKDSEAWRSMMTLSAQYKDRAGSGGGGGGGGGRGGRGGAGGYNSEANRYPGKKEYTYDSMVGILTGLAQAEGILNTEKEDLGDLRVAEGDAGRMVSLMNVWNSIDPNDDTPQGRYKKTVIDQIRKYGDQNFDGTITFDKLNSEKKNKDNGLQGRLEKAMKAGHKTDVKAITKEWETASSEFLKATAAEPLAAYEDARKRFTIARDDQNGTPLDLAIAMEKFHGELVALKDGVTANYGVDQPGASPEASILVGHLNNEILGLEGKDVNGPTLWEDSRGVVAAYHQEGGEASNTAFVKTENEKQLELLLTGKGYMSRVDNSGNPTDDAEADIKVIPVSLAPKGTAIVGATGYLPPSITVAGKIYNPAVAMTAIKGSPITVVGTTGETDLQGRFTATVKPETDNNVANGFTMPDGTKLVQFWDANGDIRWTSNPAGLFVGPNGEVLTPDENGVVTMPVGLNMQSFKPNSAVSPAFMDPSAPDKLPNQVMRSSYSAWLSSTRTDVNDPGVAYSQDPAITAAAITAEVGAANPVKLGAALDEGEQTRTDYLQGLTDREVRLRTAAKLNVMPILADQLGIEDTSIIGLRRDVEGFYQRLNNGQTGGEEVRGGNITSEEQRERDRLVRAALEQDDIEAYRIAGFDTGGVSRITPMELKYGGAASLAKRMRDVKTVGPGSGWPGSTVTFDENRNVMAMRAAADKSLADALGVGLAALPGPKRPQALTGGFGPQNPAGDAAGGTGPGFTGPNKPPPVKKPPPYNPYAGVTPGGQQPYGGKPPSIAPPPSGWSGKRPEGKGPTR